MPARAKCFLCCLSLCPMLTQIARLKGEIAAMHQASIEKNAADDPAIQLAEDLPVAAVLGKGRVCVQVTRHGRSRA
jgi:hypothetical protein